MLTADEALLKILEFAAPLPAVRRPILEALGGTLAEDIAAREDLPSWPNSAMDGYAVQAAGTANSSRSTPARLPVVGCIGAGQTFPGRLEAGQAVKIMTGAPVPEGADAIVIVEETDGAKHGDVRIYRPVRIGDHIRPRGEEVRAGELVIARGKRLRASEIGLLAALGYADVAVHETPRVAVLATGDELREPGESLTIGQIRNSNSYSMLSQVVEAGGVPLNLGIGRDRPDELLRKMRDGLEHAHVLITSGGVSMGDYDFVQDIMKKLDGTVHFGRVAIAPGKPTTFATVPGRLLFGLPGNPVSSMVTFELFVRPALRRLAGASPIARPMTTGRLTADFRKRPGRRHYLRCVMAEGPQGRLLTPTGTQSSGVLRSMSLANALAVVESEVEFVAAGEELPAILLDFPEAASLPGG